MSEQEASLARRIAEDVLPYMERIGRGGESYTADHEIALRVLKDAAAALTDSQSDSGSARALLSRQLVARATEIQHGPDELNRRPGTPMWRLNRLAEWAEKELGHDPLSSRGFEQTIIERVAELKRARTEALEEAAHYHDNSAQECDRIAAVNMDNDLGPDCITRAQDHRMDAAAIRALKDKP